MITITHYLICSWFYSTMLSGLSYIVPMFLLSKKCCFAASVLILDPFIDILVLGVIIVPVLFTGPDSVLAALTFIGGLF